MLEITKVGDRTYYIPNATNIGIYLENDNEAWVIDTGIDDGTGRKILRQITDKGWTIKGIICTHSHADHIGGNKAIVSKTDCRVLAHGAERAIAEFTFLNNTAVYGGYPYEGITNKFFYSEPAGKVEELADNLPQGLEFFELPGHTYSMIGIKTPDDVYFLADSLVSEVTVTKYHVFYLYDIAAHLETLSFLSSLSSANAKSGTAAMYIPSHCEATESIDELIKLNRDKITEIKNYILSVIQQPTTLESIVTQVFNYYGLTMNASQHTLLTGTLRSFLSYLSDNGLAEILFEDNKMYFKAV